MSIWDSSYSRKYGRPFKVLVCLVTLAAFFVNILSYDLAWAAESIAGLTHVGPAAGSPGAVKELNVKTFRLPEYLGAVKDSHNINATSPVVIHIQDAHCNYACQKRIAEIVEYLNKEYGINTINLEGGAEGYDLSPFTDIENRQTRLRASDYFVKEGLVNGSELFAINNPEKVTLWGVEDVGLYVENLAVYRDSLKHKAEIDRYIRSLGQALSGLKSRVYSKELFELDLKYSQYKAGNLDFKGYLSYLFNLAKARGVDIKNFTNAYILNQVMEEEGKIDFKQANNERDSLIDKLQKKVSERLLEELVAKTVEFKAERISQKDFYAYLTNKAAVFGIDLEDFQQLKKYIVYSSMYGAIDSGKAIDELDRLEDAVKDSLYRNDDEKVLSELSKNLALLKNIFNTTLTKDDWRYYKANEEKFCVANFVDFINAKAPIYRVETRPDKDVSVLDQYRGKIVKFFEWSLKRDEAFVRNMKVKGQGKESAILVTGGFHTENLAELFKKNGISYVSIMPNFKNCDGYECPYFKILSGEKNVRIKDVLPSVITANTLAIPDQMCPKMDSVENLVDSSEKTRVAYDEITGAYAVLNREMDPGVGRLMNEAIEAAPVTGGFVDVGTGHGRGAYYMQTISGRSVIGIDYSDEQLEQARKAYPDLIFERMDVRDMSSLHARPEFTNGAALLWADAIFHHIEPKDADKVLQQFNISLMDGGILAMTTKEGSGEGMEVNPKYPSVQRYFKRYTAQELRILLERNGFEVLKLLPDRKGDRSTWIHVLAKKKGPRSENVIFDSEPSIENKLAMPNPTEIFHGNINAKGDGREALKAFYAKVVVNPIDVDIKDTFLITQVIHNFVLKSFDFENSKESGLELAVEYSPVTVKDGEEEGILKISIIQPDFTAAEWGRLAEDAGDFNAKGSDYLMDKYRSHGDSLVDRNSHFLFKFANIAKTTPAALRYERMPGTSQVRSELRIGITKIFKTSSQVGAPPSATLFAPWIRKLVGDKWFNLYARTAGPILEGIIFWGVPMWLGYDSRLALIIMGSIFTLLHLINLFGNKSPPEIGRMLAFILPAFIVSAYTILLKIGLEGFVPSPLAVMGISFSAILIGNIIAHMIVNTSYLIAHKTGKSLTFTSNAAALLTALTFIITKDASPIATALRALDALFTPAAIITAIWVIYEFSKRPPQAKEEKGEKPSKLMRFGRRGFIFSTIGIFMANLLGINLLYIFSRDRTVQQDKIHISSGKRKIRPVGTDPQGLKESDTKSAIPENTEEFIDFIRGLDLNNGVSRATCDKLIAIFKGGVESQGHFARKVSRTITREEIYFLIKSFWLLDPNRINDFEMKWIAMELQLIILVHLGLYLKEDFVEDSNARVIFNFYEELIDIKYDGGENLLTAKDPKATTSALLKSRMLGTLRGLTQAIHTFANKIDIQERAGQLWDKASAHEDPLPQAPHYGFILNRLFYEKESAYTESEFNEAVAYYQSLIKGPLRPINIENIDLVGESRQILRPLVPYLKDSGEYHKVASHVLAAFILTYEFFNRYDPRYRLSPHYTWALDRSSDEDKSHLILRFMKRALSYLPQDIDIQDRAVDILGAVAGGSPTFGRTQVRAGPFRDDPDFIYKRNVKRSSLFGRFIDTTSLGNREINLYLSNPKYGIEAMAKLWGLTLDQVMRWNDANTPPNILMPDLRYFRNNEWLYEGYDYLGSRIYGPNMLMAYISQCRTPVFNVATINPLHPMGNEFFEQMMTSFKAIDIDKYLETCHEIALESGVFDDPEHSIPAVIVGCDTPEKVDKLYDVARGEDDYLRNAAIRSLTELTKESEPNIEIRRKATLLLNRLQKEIENPELMQSLGVPAALLAVGALSQSNAPVSRRNFLTLGMSDREGPPAPSQIGKKTFAGLLLAPFMYLVLNLSDSMKSWAGDEVDLDMLNNLTDAGKDAGATSFWSMHIAHNAAVFLMALLGIAVVSVVVWYVSRIIARSRDRAALNAMQRRPIGKLPAIGSKDINMDTLLHRDPSVGTYRSPMISLLRRILEYSEYAKQPVSDDEVIQLFPRAMDICVSSVDGSSLWLKTSAGDSYTYRTLVEKISSYVDWLRAERKRSGGIEEFVNYIHHIKAQQGMERISAKDVPPMGGGVTTDDQLREMARKANGVQIAQYVVKSGFKSGTMARDIDTIRDVLSERPAELAVFNQRIAEDINLSDALEAANAGVPIDLAVIVAAVLKGLNGDDAKSEYLVGILKRIAPEWRGRFMQGLSGKGEYVLPESLRAKLSCEMGMDNDALEIAQFVNHEICKLLLGAKIIPFTLQALDEDEAEIISGYLSDSDKEIRAIIDDTVYNVVSSEELFNLYSHHLKGFIVICGYIESKKSLADIEAVAKKTSTMKKVAEDFLVHYVQLLTKQGGGNAEQRIKNAIEGVDISKEVSKSDIVENIEKAAERTGLKLGKDIIIDVNNAPEYVVGNELLITLIMNNLLKNAVDAGSKSPIKVTIMLSRETGMVSIIVEDNGAGISPEVLPRVFEYKFTTKEKRGGSGLGLCAARHIARHHGGDIVAQDRKTANPEDEQGARFIVTLPMRILPMTGETSKVSGESPEPEEPEVDKLLKGSRIDRARDGGAIANLRPDGRIELRADIEMSDEFKDWQIRCAAWRGRLNDYDVLRKNSDLRDAVAIVMAFQGTEKAEDVLLRRFLVENGVNPDAPFSIGDDKLVNAAARDVFSGRMADPAVEALIDLMHKFLEKFALIRKDIPERHFLVTVEVFEGKVYVIDLLTNTEVAVVRSGENAFFYNTIAGAESFGAAPVMSVVRAHEAMYDEAGKLAKEISKMLNKDAPSFSLAPSMLTDISATAHCDRRVERVLEKAGHSIHAYHYAVDGSTSDTTEKLMAELNRMMPEFDEAAEANPKTKMLIRVTSENDRKAVLRSLTERLSAEKLEKVNIIVEQIEGAEHLNPVIDLLVDLGLMEMERYKKEGGYPFDAPEEFKDKVARLLRISTTNLEGLSAASLEDVMKKMFDKYDPLVIRIKAINWKSMDEWRKANDEILASA